MSTPRPRLRPFLRGLCARHLPRSDRGVNGRFQSYLALGQWGSHSSYSHLAKINESNPLSPFPATHPRTASLSLSFATLTKTKDFKSFPCHTYEKSIGGTPSSSVLAPHLLERRNSPARTLSRTPLCTRIDVPSTDKGPSPQNRNYTSGPTSDFTSPLTAYASSPAFAAGCRTLAAMPYFAFTLWGFYGIA